MILAILNGVKSFLNLICSFLMISDVEHFSIPCWPLLCILLKDLFRFGSLLLFFFTLVVLDFLKKDYSKTRENEGRSLYLLVLSPNGRSSPCLGQTEPRSSQLQPCCSCSCRGLTLGSSSTAFPGEVAEVCAGSRGVGIDRHCSMRCCYGE